MSDNYSVSDTDSEDLSGEDITVKIPQNFQNERRFYNRKVVYPDTTKVKSHMLIKKNTDVKKCIAYCIELLYNKQYPYVKLSAVSTNMDKAVFMAELLKRKIKNIHQVNELSTNKSFEIYTPTKPSEGRFKFKIDKPSTSLHIFLYRNVPKETKVYGYQEPIQISLVSTRDPREYIDYVLKLENQPKKKKQLNKMRNHQKNHNYQQKDSHSKQQYQKQMNYQKRHQNNRDGDKYQNRDSNDHYVKKVSQNKQNDYVKKDSNQKYVKKEDTFNSEQKNQHHSGHYKHNQNKNYQKQPYKQKQYQKKDNYQKNTQKNDYQYQKKNQNQENKKNPQDYPEYYYKNNKKQQQEFEYVKITEQKTETEYYRKKTD